MNSFAAELQHRLLAIGEQGLLRELRRVDSPQGPRLTLAGRELLNFSSNDYLGLANHPALKSAAIRAVEKFGAGTGASRLLCGSLSPFHELEESLAAFKGAEAALTFATGYAAALGTIPALIGKDDLIITDKLVHACIVDAARLSGAEIQIFAHNDLNELEEILQDEQKKSRTTAPPRRLRAGGHHASRNLPDTSHLTRRTLIVTESVFSMDGDHAPLREMVALKERYGAWLMVDEAHATGLYGANRRGLAEQLGVSDRIEIQMGTLGKALGASGGYICGRRCLIDFLINRARSFIFSTAPVPAAAAAATAGIQLVQSPEGAARAQQLWQRTNEFHASRITHHVSRLLPPASPPSAIIPLILGDEVAAVSASAWLRELGIFVPAIRYPTVVRGSARLRITVTAAHSTEDVGALVSALSQILNRKS